MKQKNSTAIPNTCWVRAANLSKRTIVSLICYEKFYDLESSP